MAARSKKRRASRKKKPAARKTTARKRPSSRRVARKSKARKATPKRAAKQRTAAGRSAGHRWLGQLKALGAVANDTGRFRVLGAIVEGGQEGTLFVRMVGPAAQVDAQREAWEMMVRTIRVVPSG